MAALDEPFPDWASLVAAMALVDGALTVALGSFAFPDLVGNAVDGDTETHTFMGDTVGTSDRLRLTIGFQSTAPVPLPAGLPLLASGLIFGAWQTRRRRGR